MHKPARRQPRLRRTARGDSSRDAFISLRYGFRSGSHHGTRLVQPSFSSLNFLRLTKSYTFAPHQHNEFELILVVRGPYHCRLNGTELRLKTNSVLLVQPGDWHEDFCRPPLEYVGLRFTLKSLGDSTINARFFRDGILPGQQWTALSASGYLQLLDRIATETGRHDPAAAHIQDALLDEFFWRLVRVFDSRLVAGWLLPGLPDEQFRSRLYQCFAQNASHPLPVAQLARALALSQRTLSLRCRKLLGSSPAKIFLRFKIEHARELLSRTEMSVKEVSYRLGFSNPYHFSRVYKQALGRSPSADKTASPG
jgi:AraC-like DNA-binding protein